MLLKHPTIQALGEAIEGKSELTWASLVPFRASGNKPPLFCVHAGGGHVFFFNDLTRHLGPDQPVYSLQPKGLDGVEYKHESIEEMAAHYCKEMLSVCPEGPFNLLTTCNGNAVCLEIARQLSHAEYNVSNIFIIDSAPRDLEAVPQSSVKRFVNRYYKLIRKGDLKVLLKRYIVMYRTIKRKWVYWRLNKQERNLADMQQHIVVLSRNYTWEPYDGIITLIRSSQFNADSMRDFHIPHWKELALKELKVHVIEGRHDSLFEEPDVKNLAAQISKCLLPVETIRTR
jgi:thioesterase domain-containing protein